MRKIEILDTTLRDGEQTVGVNLNEQEKLEIALRLERLGIDIIEAGFPASSDGALQSVKLIASKLTTSAVAAMARARREDIDKAWEAISCAKKPILHIVLATSDLHLKDKLGKTRKQAIDMIRESVSYAKSLCESVQFSAEDSSRSDLEFLSKAFSVAVEAGATRLNITDTVGYSQPNEFAAIFAYCREHVTGIENVVLAAHCHNDLGLAIANSLAAIGAGAGQIEGTLVGLGERAGNAALEEIIMALHLRGEYYGACTDIQIRRLYRACSIVASLTGVIVAANKPIIGNNIFTHESGIHQHGVLKNPLTYEIFSAKDIGRSSEGDTLALGKHSGRHAFERHLENMGYSLTPDQIGETFTRFKELCDRKKNVSDEDIEVLISDNVRLQNARYKLSYFHIISGNTLLATATVRLERSGEFIEEAACGDGPIDAIFRALDRAAGIELSLLEYTMRAVTGGKDALAEVTVKVSKGSRTLIGRGISTDTLEAGARAYVAAINKFII